MIYTIGHSVYEIELFLRMLQAHGVSTLIDVRSRPYSSHNPQFSRRALSNSLRDAGVEYRFAGKFLGGLDAISVTDPEFVKAMENVLKLQEQRRVALMCAERSPAACHRASKLTAWIHTHYTSEEVSTSHIMPTGLLDGRSYELQRPNGWSELERRSEQLELGLT